MLYIQYDIDLQDNKLKFMNFKNWNATICVSSQAPTVGKGTTQTLCMSHGEIVMLKYDLSVTKFSFDAELG